MLARRGAAGTGSCRGTHAAWHASGTDTCASSMPIFILSYPVSLSLTIATWYAVCRPVTGLSPRPRHVRCATCARIWAPPATWHFRVTAGLPHPLHCPRLPSTTTVSSTPSMSSCRHFTRTGSACLKRPRPSSTRQLHGFVFSRVEMPMALFVLIHHPPCQGGGAGSWAECSW